VAQQAGVQQWRVPVEELLEAGGRPALPVHGDAPDPAACDRLVEFGGLAVRGSDLANRGGDGVGRPVGVMPGEVAPGELDVLTMAEARAPAEDVMKDLPVLAVHHAILPGWAVGGAVAARRPADRSHPGQPARLTRSTAKTGRASATVAAQLLYRGSL
jgi:hypothetical protein